MGYAGAILRDRTILLRRQWNRLRSDIMEVSKTYP